MLLYKMLKNKLYHLKVLLRRLPLNVHTQELELHTT